MVLRGQHTSLPLDEDYLHLLTLAQGKVPVKARNRFVGSGTFSSLSAVVAVRSGSDDSQGEEGNEIEKQKDDFKQAEKCVNEHVEAFSGDRKPEVLRAIDQIRGESAEQGPQGQDAAVDDAAPHEEVCQRLNIHSISAYLLVLRYSYPSVR